MEPAIAQQQILVRRARNALLPQVVEQQGSTGLRGARKASKILPTKQTLTNAAPRLVRHVVEKVAETGLDFAATSI